MTTDEAQKQIVDLIVSRPAVSEYATRLSAILTAFGEAQWRAGAEAGKTAAEQVAWEHARLAREAGYERTELMAARLAVFIRQAPLPTPVSPAKGG